MVVNFTGDPCGRLFCFLHQVLDCDREFRNRSSRMKLNHMALTVSDRARSAGFYGTWFGLTKAVHEDDHLLILSNSNGDYLALSEGKVPLQPPRTTHFGFQADSVDAVYEIRKKFAHAGVEEAEWQEQGTIRVQVFDPDGYRVDVYAFDF